MMPWDHGTGMMVVMAIVWLLVVVAVVALVVFLVRAATGQQRSSRDRRGPLVVLEERYARGEIDEEEFERRRERLR